jgi:cephalosporin hydroxylase
VFLQARYPRLAESAVIDDIFLHLSARNMSTPSGDLDEIFQVVDHYIADSNSIVDKEWLEATPVRERSGIDWVDGCYRGYGKYQRVSMQQSRDSMEGLASTVAKNSPSTVLEIGTAMGGSLFLWSQYLESATDLIAIDIDFSDREDFYRRFRPDLNMHFIEGDSHNERTITKVNGVLNERKLDFLFIDGDHSYNGVKADFETYSRFLADGGIVGFDDINHPGNGVPDFWSELKTEYETVEFGESVTKCGLVYV